MCSNSYEREMCRCKIGFIFYISHSVSLKLGLSSAEIKIRVIYSIIRRINLIEKSFQCVVVVKDRIRIEDPIVRTVKTIRHKNKFGKVRVYMTIVNVSVVNITLADEFNTYVEVAIYFVVETNDRTNHILSNLVRNIVAIQVE